MYHAGFLGELLWQRTAPHDETCDFLDRLHSTSGVRASVVVYGHDRVDEGWSVENPALLDLSTSYGMRRARKTWLRLDISSSINA